MVKFKLLMLVICQLVACHLYAQGKYKGGDAERIFVRICQAYPDSLYYEFASSYGVPVNVNSCYSQLPATKQVYENDTIKRYLIALLTDTIGWTNFHVERSMHSYDKYVWISDKAIREVAAKENIEIDSIKSNQEQMKRIRDRARMEEIERLKSVYMNRFQDMLPFNLCYLVARLHYSEGYDFFYRCWNKEGKRQTSKYYDLLAMYQCPEIMSQYEGIAQADYYDENGKNARTIIYKLHNSYKIRLIMKLLTKTYNHINVEALAVLFDEMRYGNFAWDIVSPIGECVECDDEEIRQLDLRFGEMLRYYDLAHLSPMKKEKLDAYSKYLADNVDYILPYIERYYKYCLDGEKYWLRNLPFYKGEEY